jgi:hypothetical protein
MRVIERATAHFKSKSVKTIEVPEWGDEGEPLIIYVEPFTLKDQGRLQNATKGSSESEALAELLVLKCLDSEGQKMFTIEDKHALRSKVDADIIARIASQIMMVNVEAVEKN